MVSLHEHEWLRADDDDMATEMEELHVSALRLILLALVVLAILADYVWTIATNSYVDLPRFGFMWILVAAAGVSYWSLRHGVKFATRVFVAALLVVLTIALTAFHTGLLAFWFTPIVIVASVILGWREGIATAVLASVVILLHNGRDEISIDIALGALLLTWVSLLTGWILAYPTRIALRWAWHSYIQAMHLAEELRDRRGQLERTLKSLNLAYERLEQLNNELARAHQAAEQGRRLKAEFAAAISHELRTPLNLIVGFSEMMVTTPQAYGGQALPEAYRIDLDAIFRNAGHLSNLVDDVLDLSQIEADRMALHKEQVHLARVVDEAATTMARFFSAKGLTLDVDVPWDLPTVHADRTRVRQILINLLSNAARFTAQGGVTVRARRDGSDVIISVADTGSGIASEHLRTIFDEFRQVRVFGERRVVGSGLGLAVTKRFVELHGGSIWVESQVGQGTTFSFSLPFCDNVMASSLSSTNARWTTNSSEHVTTDPAIVVIDREGEAARLLGRHLDGYRVLAAKGVEAAREIAAETVIEAALVVSDGGPPPLAAIHRIGEAFPHVPIITCSLRAHTVMPREWSVAALLSKPVGREQVRLALRRLGRQVRGILIVDDDPEMVRLMSGMVRMVSRRYVVSGATSAREAMAHLETRRPDAIFLDLVMPELGGDEFLRWIRGTTAYRDIPIVLVSGHDLAHETITAEFVGIAQKDGLTVRELVRCLKASLEAIQRPQATLVQHLEQIGSPNRLGDEVRCPHGEGESALVDDGADDDWNIRRRGIELEGL